MHWRRHQVASRWLATGTLTALFTACGSSSHSSTGPGSGSLAVTITAPAGITPSVTINGPGNYVKVISATTTLTGLTAGSYTITAARVATTAPIVSTLYVGKVTGSPATISSSTTSTVKVTYAVAPGSGYLWATTSIDTFSLVAFDTAQLSTSGAPAPAITLQPTAGSLFQPQHTAFDSSGTLWVESSDTLTAFSPATLAASGTATPSVTIAPENGSLAGPFSMAFDAAGYLWIANVDSADVVGYAPQQLASSGAPVPAITLRSDSAFVNPEGLAFDAHGNLWVSSWTFDSAPGNLQEFTPTQLKAGGKQAPTLKVTGPGLQYPSALAFDVSGNLWVANDADTIAEYAASQLAAGGAQTPQVILTDGPTPCQFPNQSPPPLCNGPDGLAFDNSGNLWVANGVGSATESIIEYSASQLATSGSPTPTVTLTPNGPSILGAAGLTFYPHAAGLPLSY